MSFWCMGTNAHKQFQPSQQKPASPQQIRTCWTFARACEACAAMCCDCYLWKPIMQDKKRFSLFRKERAKLQHRFSENRYFQLKTGCATRLHTSKYKRPCNKSNDGCLWKPAKCSNVCASKQLQFVASAETRLYIWHSKVKMAVSAYTVTYIWKFKKEVKADAMLH